MDRPLKIVITGGPGGGKTTALDLFKRELLEKVTVVSEAATLLFQGGVSRSGGHDAQAAIQRAIYKIQIQLEEISHLQSPNSLLLCDRGTLDGLAYWPDVCGNFFDTVESTLERELARYDAVIFFETAAKSGKDIRGNNPIRNESSQRSIELDEKLKKVWCQHPDFHFVPSSESFIKKTMFGIMTIENLIDKYSRIHQI